MKYDVVYIYKNVGSEELKYSIRSVEKNFPYNKIVVAGDRPSDLVPDYFLAVDQNMEKCKNALNILYNIVNCSEISDDFWLFNDDFFIMKPVKRFSYYHNGSLLDLIEKYKAKFGENPYVIKLKNCYETLYKNNCTSYNYELHIPMLFNKYKLKQLFKDYPQTSCTRSLYGNVYDVGGKDIIDVKIYDGSKPSKTAKLLSTTEGSFKEGIVGQFIKEQFKEMSSYEQRKNHSL